MGATVKSDFAFDPKVWQDHVRAYFRDKLVVGRFAVVDETLTARPGETVNMPYFKQIGAVEEPGESEGLQVDRLQDDAFSATVKEVGKAVGVKKAALRKSAASEDRIYREMQSQIARRFAEKVDSDLITEMNTSGNYVQGNTIADGVKCTVTNIVNGVLTAFGDQAEEVQAYLMHSLNLATLLTDSTTGLLKADASMPWFGTPGFGGTLMGKPIFLADKMPADSAVNSKKVFHMFAIKQAPFGFMLAEEMDFDQDKDILHREWVVAATEWYAVKAFHAKVSTQDLRICRLTFQTDVAA